MASPARLALFSDKLHFCCAFSSSSSSALVSPSVLLVSKKKSRDVSDLSCLVGCHVARLSISSYCLEPIHRSCSAESPSLAPGFVTEHTRRLATVLCFSLPPTRREGAPRGGQWLTPVKSWPHLLLVHLEDWIGALNWKEGSLIPDQATVACVHAPRAFGRFG